MNIVKKKEKLEKEEKNLRDRFKELKNARNDILSEYYKTKCKDKYDEIKETVESIMAYKKCRKHGKESAMSNLNSLILKCLKGIRSKRVVTDYKIKVGWLRGKLTLYYNGLGILPRWGHRSKRIEELHILIKILTDDEIDLEQYVYKNGKKEMLNTLSKFLEKYKSLKDDNLNLDNKLFQFDSTDIEILDKDRYFGKKTKTVGRLNINPKAYYGNITFKKSQSRWTSEYSSNINDDIPEYKFNHLCYILYQIWDKIGDEFKNYAKKCKKRVITFQKVYDNIKKKVSHNLLAEEL